MLAILDIGTGLMQGLKKRSSAERKTLGVISREAGMTAAGPQSSTDNRASAAVPRTDGEHGELSLERSRSKLRPNLPRGKVASHASG